MSKSPEDEFAAISVADLMKHPRFSGHLRDLILALDERRGDVSVADLASIVGIGPDELIRRIISETVFAEFRRIAAGPARDPRAH